VFGYFAPFISAGRGHRRAPCFLSGVVDGLAALSKNGLRFPIPPDGIQSDASAGLAVSDPDRGKER
jgi:hypothetical protein